MASEPSHYLKRIQLPSGKTIEVMYFDDAAERERRKAMEEWVDVFVGGLQCEAILPEDF